jgi:hypothetical protein
MEVIGYYCQKGSLEHEFEAIPDEKMNVTLTCLKCNQKQSMEIGYQFDEIIKNEGKS